MRVLPYSSSTQEPRLSMGSRRLCCVLMAVLLTLAGDSEAAERDQQRTSSVLPRVHVVRGLWHKFYRLEEALGLLGGAAITDSWHGSNGGNAGPGTWERKVGTWVTDFPSAQDLARNQLLVVCNINGKPLPADVLKTYVSRGGGALFLGGRYAFGGEYHRAPLEELMPVTFATNVIDLRCATNGLVLRPTPSAPAALRDLDWKKSPRIYWYHEVQPRPGAEVLLEADGKPMLIRGVCGQGTVLLFAGSVMGVPQEGQTPLWMWPDWPNVLAGVLRQILEHPRAPVVEPLDEKKKKAIWDEALGDKSIGPHLPALISVCTNRTAAVELLDLLNMSSSDLEPLHLDSVADAILPFVDSTFAETARRLVQSGKVNKGCLGLRVLACSQAPDARDILTKTWGSGELPQKAGTVSDMGLDDLAEAAAASGSELAGRDQVRVMALTAIGDLGDPAMCPLIRNEIDKRKGGAGKPTDRISDAGKRYQRAVIAAVCCGDTGWVGPVVGIYLDDVYAISRARTYVSPVPGQIAECTKTLPDSKKWREIFLTQMERVPASLLPAFAKRIAAEKDERIVPLAFRIFGGRPLGADVRQILAQSPVQAVANLAKGRP